MSTTYFYIFFYVKLYSQFWNLTKTQKRQQVFLSAKTKKKKLFSFLKVHPSNVNWDSTQLKKKKTLSFWTWNRKKKNTWMNRVEPCIFETASPTFILKFSVFFCVWWYLIYLFFVFIRYCAIVLTSKEACLLPETRFCWDTLSWSGFGALFCSIFLMHPW